MCWAKGRWDDPRRTRLSPTTVDSFAQRAKSGQTDSAVPPWIRTLLGDVSVNEIALVAVVFALILLFTWAPRIGEAIGGFLGGDDRDDPS